MFGIGPMEMGIIAVVALLIFGPEKLPEMMGQAGKLVRDFRNMTSEMTGEFEKTVAEAKGVGRQINSEMGSMTKQVSSVTNSVQKELGGTKKTGAKGLQNDLVEQEIHIWQQEERRLVRQPAPGGGQVKLVCGFIFVIRNIDRLPFGEQRVEERRGGHVDHHGQAETRSSRAGVPRGSLRVDLAVRARRTQTSASGPQGHAFGIRGGHPARPLTERVRSRPRKAQIRRRTVPPTWTTRLLAPGNDGRRRGTPGAPEIR